MKSKITLILLFVEIIACAGNGVNITKLCVSTPVGSDIQKVNWRDIRKNNDFIPYRHKKLVMNTFFKVANNGSNLFIKILCDEKNINGIDSSHKVRDGKLWEDNSVEIFLSPDKAGSRYFHIIINNLNAIYDGSNISGKYTSSWNCNGMRSYVDMNKTSWEVLLAIPFKALQEPPPPSSAIWRMNICRNRKTSTTSELSSWSKPVRGFHNPAGYGFLSFGNLQPSLKALLLETEKKISEKQKFMTKHFQQSKVKNDDSLRKQYMLMEKRLAAIRTMASSQLRDTASYSSAIAFLKSAPATYEKMVIDVQMEELLK